MTDGRSFCILNRTYVLIQKGVSQMDLSAQQREALMSLLQARFEENINRHADLAWMPIQAKLEAHPHKLWSLHEMEQTGGEPDVVGYDADTDEYLFYDCSPESPQGRRSLCYDDEALEARKANKPRGSALGMAKAMGVAILDEEAYRALQQLGEFDKKTSSWVETTGDVRKLGGALFGDRRYGRVFIYHNGADSYYGARGFRASLRV